MICEEGNTPGLRRLLAGVGRERGTKSMMFGRLTLRPVQEEDCRLIWKLANDPSARAFSFSSEVIPWDDHVRWFKSKLNDPHCFFYVAINENGIPVGQVRFDRDKNEIVTSVSIDNKFRGKGYGNLMIELASRELSQVTDVQVIHAYIKKENEASRRAFLKAGFKRIGITVINGQKAIHFILPREEMIL